MSETSITTEVLVRKATVDPKTQKAVIKAEAEGLKITIEGPGWMLYSFENSRRMRFSLASVVAKPGTRK